MSRAPPARNGSMARALIYARLRHAANQPERPGRRSCATHAGRRVLTYADLHTIGEPLDVAGVLKREIEMHLTGNMKRYHLVARRASSSAQVHQPSISATTERLRVVLVNDSDDVLSHVYARHVGTRSKSPGADVQWR